MGLRGRPRAQRVLDAEQAGDRRRIKVASILLTAGVSIMMAFSKAPRKKNHPQACDDERLEP